MFCKTVKVTPLYGSDYFIFRRFLSLRGHKLYVRFCHFSEGPPTGLTMTLSAPPTAAAPTTPNSTNRTGSTIDSGVATERLNET